jgi:ABC-2 type transport system permease protein
MKPKLTAKYRYSVILLKELVITEFKLRYQNSVLGYLWSLLRPLFLFVVLYFVFIYFLKVGSDVPYWPIAMLFGIVMWNFFIEVTNNGLASVVSRGDVIRKINFPKYVIILSSSISAFINLAFNLAVLSVFMVIAGVNLTWTAVIAPLFIIEIFLFALGLAFILSTLSVRLRDINYIWEILLQALFYGSAIVYPISLVVDINPLLAKLILLNPFTQALQDARHFLISDHNETMYSLTGNILLSILPILLAIGVLVFGAWLFRKRSPYFAEEV